MSRIPVTAIILTRNEAENLPACIDTVRWADEILVVDALSTDNTAEIAESLGARVVRHRFENFAAQRNFAQQEARHDWVLFVDADERVSPELAAEITHLAERGELGRFNAYHIQRVHLFSGKWIPDPATRKVTPRLRKLIRRTEMPRLLNRQVAVWVRPLHEELRVPEPRGVLDGVIYHYGMSSLSLYLESLNFYTDLEAAYLHRRRRRCGLLEAGFRGVRSFVFHYLVRGLWRYGEQGLLLAVLLGFTKFLDYAKLAERIRVEAGRGNWTPRDLAVLRHYSQLVAVADRS
jgi:glycosyltransferase involved in cell wall biosynthesis